MQSKETLKIKETVLKRLIKLVKRPLFQYIDILSHILKGLEISYFSLNTQRQVDFINAIERFKHFFNKIKKSIVCCSDIAGINMLYNQLVEFLNQFDSFKDRELLLGFQPLIINFNYFHSFFQSFRVINDIHKKFFMESDSNQCCDHLILQKEIQWYITFQEDLLGKLILESKTKIKNNQNNDEQLNYYRPKFYRHNCYVKDIYQ